MTPLSRESIAILLDSPEQKDYVVSAFADLTIKDGFRDLFEAQFRNQARALALSLAGTDAAVSIEADLNAVRGAILDEVDRTAKGAAVFVSGARGLRHVMPLDFPLENRLVVDEDPFVRPLLEAWYGEPSYLVGWFDSDHAHVIEAHHGGVSEVQDIDRIGAHGDPQGDKPRFTYKQRFARTFHERLHGADDDNYFRDVVEALAAHWSQGDFRGLILLGRPTVLGAMRQLLTKDLAAAVVAEIAHSPANRPDDVAAEVSRVVESWHNGRDAEVGAEIQERLKENYLLATGASEVLDALQQGRAARVVCGRGRDLPGASCRGCGYRFGTPAETCPYCGGTCRTIDAMQEILRMALQHRVPVHIFRRSPGAEPTASFGGVAAFLRAEANWAPDKATAQATRS